MAGIQTIKPTDALNEQIDLHMVQMINLISAVSFSPENGKIVAARRDIHYGV